MPISPLQPILSAFREGTSRHRSLRSAVGIFIFFPALLLSVWTSTIRCRIAPSYQPHLVLTDLQMPRLDGAGLLSHIKHIAPDTPVILFTAHSDLGAEREAQRLGADDYLNKPLDLDEMLGRIAQAVS